MKWTHGILARLRLLRRGEAEERMEEEIRFHLEMETEENLRAGMSPEEARRRAVLAFGGVEGHKEHLREGQTLAWTSGFSLDLRLGWRMLRKYPGLTVVGVLGMAIAIAIGAASFEILYTMIDADLPLDEGDRVVALQYWDAATNRAERGSPHDLVAWRAELESVQELSAFRDTERNLIVPGGAVEPVAVAEMTASAFQVARVPPLLGRPLVGEDERHGAPGVVVIGYDVWQTRFQGDPDVVGRDVRLGNIVYTVVGVMPEGFAFPVNHSYWAPLRADPLDYERREGPALFVFGRLATGVTMDEAQAELATVGQRMAASYPVTYGQLRPQVLPYTHPFSDMEEPGMAWMFHLVQVLISLLLVVVAVNVAILVYARTATRMGEIVVRGALGASRGRIVAQLSVEALVLSAGAAAAGLLIVWLGLTYWGVLVVDRRPFWLEFELSPGTILYAAGLAVLGAMIVGVVPALKATGREMQSRLRQLGGGTGMQMGRTWTVLIVVQVAIAVAVLPVAAAAVWGEFRPGLTGPNFAAGEFLTARLAMNQESPPAAQDSAGQHQIGSRFADRHTELMRRLKAEPNVSAVTFAARLPSVKFSGSTEVDAGRPEAEPARHMVRFLQVDRGFLDVFDATILAGRSFHSADMAGVATAVVANRSFVQKVLGGGDALGRRFRYTRTEDNLRPGDVELGDWYEIVGVVSDFPANEAEPGLGTATLYHPAAPGRLNPVSLIVQVQGITPELFAGRLREITAALDPNLRLNQVLSMDELHRQEQRGARLVAATVAVVALSVLLLSAGGIHALMSFTIAQRRKEIGIRAALGAHPRRILASVFARALRQLSLGLAIGCLVAGLVLETTITPPGQAAVFVLIVAVLVLAVGLLATLGPARRGLRIQPMEALREE